MLDAVVIGSGPNGLAAAVTLAKAGRSVLVLEAEPTIGGGTRTEEVTLPGFRHDVCSAIHPLGILSPFFRELDLGIAWAQPPVPLAHPFEDGHAAVLLRDMDETARRFGGSAVEDAASWREMFAPYMEDPHGFFAAVLAPIRVPRDPFLLARFGMTALQPATWVARRSFRGDARALFMGCAAHSIVPLDDIGTASFGMVLGLAAHAAGWPVAPGGSQTIANALVQRLEEHGGTIETGRRVRSLAELPASRAVLFDVMPRQLADIAGDALPASYKAQLRRFKHGPGIFKIDWALDGPIPWTAPECREAGTVHLGSTFEEIAASERANADGRVTDKPFMLVAQQSLFDPTRAPAGKHTGWAYCHVPNGSTVDHTELLESRIERFAPGFRDLILARKTWNTADIEAHNASYVGGDIGGGANALLQVIARPALRWNEYTTPNPRLFLCSAATPPGGGVHGMCGWESAKAVLRSQP